AALAAFTGSSFHVLHVCGTRDYPALAAGALTPRYDLREYLPEADFPQALAAADLVVARSGGSVFELAAHSLPAILVPYPHAAGGHQSANAAWMSAAGAAVVIPREELTPSRPARAGAARLRRRAGAGGGGPGRGGAGPAPGRRGGPGGGCRGPPADERRRAALARAPLALRRRRRRGHERLRPPGAGAGGGGQRVRPG